MGTGIGAGNVPSPGTPDNGQTEGSAGAPSDAALSRIVPSDETHAGAPYRPAAMSGTVRHIVSALSRHACYPHGWRSVIFDVALAAGLYAICTPPIASMTPAPQNPVLGDMSDPGVCIAWSMALFLPAACRRLAPVRMAWAFAAVCVAQLALGPSILPFDPFCLVMLYTAIVYGDRTSAPPLCLASVGIGAVASLFMAYTNVHDLAGLDCSTAMKPTATIIDTMAGCRAALLTQFSGNALGVGVLLAFTMVAAFWRRTTRDSMLLLRERTQVLASQKEQAGREAAMRERARIARDMHDVVAHTLSTIIVQADAGRYAAANDPGKARGIMLTIRREIDHARSDMAQLLGVLTDGLPDGVQNGRAKHDGTGAGASPAAPSSQHAAFSGVSYERIPELIAQASLESAALGPTTPGQVIPRSAVTHVVSGMPRPGLLSGNASICAYRVVQEALTNVRKYALGAAYDSPDARATHNTRDTPDISGVSEAAGAPDGTHKALDEAPGTVTAPRTVHVRVDERWDRTGLTLRISDDGIGAGSSSDGHAPGFGLMGMAERLRSVGGTLHAGPRADTEGPGTPGFVVEAVIPYDAAAPVGASAASSASSPAPTSVASRHTSAASAAPSAAAPAPSPAPTPRQPRRNAVERMAAWSIRHERIADIIITTLLCLLTLMLDASLVGTNPPGSFVLPAPVIALLPVATCLPLVNRRRRPERSCLLVFLLCVVNMLVGTTQLPACIVPVTAALFSGTLYGRRGIGWRLAALSATGSVMVGLDMTLYEGLQPDGTMPLQGLAFAARHTGPVSEENIAIGLAYAVLSFIVCLTAIGLGNLSRSRDENLTLLRARADALEQERDARDKAAAAEERTRIGAQIQHDVSATLESVSRRVDEGLDVVDSGRATPDAIRCAFADIAQQGRSALRRMRRLLGVLRDTERGEDDRSAPSTALSKHELHPAAPLDEQLHDAHLPHA
ncbi:histidine kinase [Pseudoscardovia radai]|uniref:histidine kinase n=1 Tax=Pseudoscardovia radai TaxID=987066 RepID=A0A261EW28_9BIFI|nr:histidine kinase [Pseudoscardovia radai]OZG51045.1 histidine kinase [Pseudoscardovia radai]